MLNDLQIALLLQSQYNGEKVFDYENRIGEVSFAIKYYDACTVVLFEGSFNAADWFSNFQALMIDVPRIGRVEQGFYSSMPEAITDIMARLPGNKPVQIAGHSRGASHANVAASVLIDRGWAAGGIIRTTLAPARAGNSDFVKSLAGSPGTAYRNRKDEFNQDVVCCVPLHFLLEPYVDVDEWTNIDVPPAADDPWWVLGRHHIALYIAGLRALGYNP